MHLQKKIAIQKWQSLYVLDVDEIEEIQIILFQSISEFAAYQLKRNLVYHKDAIGFLHLKFL